MHIHLIVLTGHECAALSESAFESKENPLSKFMTHPLVQREVVSTIFTSSPPAISPYQRIMRKPLWSWLKIMTLCSAWIL